MTYPRFIYRDTPRHLLFAGGYAILVVGWILSKTGVIDVNFGGGLGEFVASLFVLLFLLPIATWMAFLALCGRPVLSLYDDRIELRDVFLPRFEAIVLRRSDIIDVQVDDNWEPNTSWQAIVFTISEGANSKIRDSRLWGKRQGCRRWYFLNNASVTPPQAVALIHEWVKDC